MITIIGASCIDIIAQNVNNSIFKSGHEYADNIEMCFGGDALNEAVILGNLKQDVELITTIGDDFAGKSIVQYCKKNKVKIIPSINGNTYISNILVDDKGNRNLVGTKDGSLRRLCLNDINEINGDIVCFASMFISNNMAVKEYETLFKRIKKEKKILCVDTTTIKHKETVDEYKNVLNKIDYFFPNLVEAKLFTRTKNVVDAANKLYESGIKNVIIKCGNKGCYIKNKKLSQYVKTNKIKPVDTTGAGDSFVAGFIYELSKGSDILTCCNRANEFGGLACQYTGATNWIKGE